jgi:hypothetical protein
MPRPLGAARKLIAAFPDHARSPIPALPSSTLFRDKIEPTQDLTAAIGDTGGQKSRAFVRA